MELEAGRLGPVRPLSPAQLKRLSVDAGEQSSSYRAHEPARRLPPIAKRAPLIRLRQVSLYVEYHRVLREVDWELLNGEHWAVFGANGAGKTSFLKLLYGDLSPALGGSIERAGHPRGTAIAAWKRRVGYVSPELQTDYAVNVTVRELVASGRHASIGLSDAPTAADARAAERWLRFFKLASYAKRRPSELSYGQMRRALFARALAAQPRLLLLDEPLTGLDPKQRSAMKGLLRRLMGRSLTVVIAVHHAEDLPPGMTHALHLCGGRAQTQVCHSAN
jgi:ABC-type molybdenum transport system ATPase subunit/photorepair protein PhrA